MPKSLQRADSTDTAPAQNRPRWQAWLETGLILLLLFTFAGTPPPDVNESHYLTKAKHYWNPDWCGADPFLESADAHLAFFWTFGWITRWASLPQTAWIGRLLTWALLAWSWRRLSYAVAPYPLAAVLSAGLFLTAMRWCHMAGEWVVGGVEAKGFAYVLVLLAIESLVRNRWNRVWIFLGGATALHVLVGGWSMVAAGLAWTIQMSKVKSLKVKSLRRADLRPSDLGLSDLPPLPKMLPGMFAGGVLALIGLGPVLALSLGVNRDTVFEANYIYVFYRLSHHLAAHTFPWWRIARFIVLCLGWVIVAWSLRHDQRQRRLAMFVMGVMIIALAGGVIDIVTRRAPLIGAQWLRYYWFRLSDFAAPAGLALGVTALAARARHAKNGHAARDPRGAWSLIVLIVIALGGLAEAHYEHRRDRRPRAVRQADPAFGLTDAQVWEKYLAWRRACKWISRKTPSHAVFLTPRNQQTFKWWAQRSEAASWKDVPQDAESLLGWRRRFEKIYPPKTFQDGLTAHSNSELIRLGATLGASYLVLDRTRSKRSLPFERVYPLAERNIYYEIYRIPANSRKAFSHE